MDYSNYNQAGLLEFNDWVEYQSPVMDQRLDAICKEYRARGIKGIVRVLDVGCGIGLFADVAKGKHLVAMDGVEPSIIQRKIARKKYINIFESIEQAPDGEYDAIHLSHVLEHIENPVDFLKKCRDKLRSIGSIYIEVPCEKYIENLANLPFTSFFKRRWVCPFHCNYFGIREMKSVLELAGFRDASIVHETFFNKRRINSLPKNYPVLKKIGVYILAALFGKGGGVIVAKAKK